MTRASLAIARLGPALIRLEKKEGRLSTSRLIYFAAAFFVVAVLAVLKHPWANGVAFVAIVGFVGLVRAHARIARRLISWKAEFATLERQAAREALDWSRLPPLPSVPAGLPRAFSDLDLVGDRSLLRLADATLSDLGWRELVARFDANGVTADEIRQRQAEVREATRLNVLRRRFARAAVGEEGRLQLARLGRLTEGSLHDGSVGRWLAVLGTLNALGLALLAGTILRGWRPYFVLDWALLWMLSARAGAHISDGFSEALDLELDLRRFGHFARVLERHRLSEGSALASLFSPFLDENRPSRSLARASRIVACLDIRAHFVIHQLLQLVMPWDLMWTVRLEALRRRIAGPLTHWLAAMARWEATVSLAELGASFDRCVWPELREERGLEATDLAHPLIPPKVRVGNPVRIDDEERCRLITGSNMSGKSTYLRTMGLGLALAKAGARVVATHFHFSDLDLYTALRVNDSLEDNASAFYAEVKELRRILDAARAFRPVFYLIDEIFRGTNNRERLLGSRAYLKALVATSALGSVATHDLELASLEELSHGILNWHFKETLEGNRMHFTYRISRGPCPSTNALRILAMEGLPTEGI